LWQQRTPPPATRFAKRQQAGLDFALPALRLSIRHGQALSPVTAEPGPRLSGLISQCKRHGVDASGSDSGDGEPEHERGTTSLRAMISSGSGLHPAARAIALLDF
jgi:hypothetical protein